MTKPTPSPSVTVLPPAAASAPTTPTPTTTTAAATTTTILSTSLSPPAKQRMKRAASEMAPGLSTDYPPPPHPENDIETTDVLVVGAGPAGLMLATNLARFGIKVKVIDDRNDKTPAGRADGLQPKTIETFKQMRIADDILRKGVKIFDISFWNSSPEESLHRTGRQDHFPIPVDVLEPYILLVHQGMVEGLFLDDMAERGVTVSRQCSFEGYRISTDKADAEFPVEAVYMDKKNEIAKKVRAKYVVGCDGAHSNVRRSMPGVSMEGESSDAFWGVLDGVVDTDFPDLWSKCAISSHDAGTILCIPRERNMTRLYIELAGDSSAKGGKISKAIANQEFVMKRAKEIMRPYKITWKEVEWFGIYQIGQRVSSSFSDHNRVFIAGDAGHTHSPKAAQGMNVSMHDSYNLAWKLAQVLQGIAPESLLDTYELERRKIACDLIRFDHEHANAFIKNDAKALAENFRTNIRFISGVGAVYGANMLNLPSSSAGSRLIPGELLPPAKATRYIDANPIDLQIDIPVLGQYRLYFLTPDYQASKYFLDVMAEFISSPQSILGRASAASKLITPAPSVDGDQYLVPARYTTTGRVFTPALITATPRHEIELEDLAPLFQEAKWTVYLDTFHSRDHCSPLRGKWWSWGGIRESETRIVVVRPDGYVGAVSGGFCAEEAERGGVWLENYFGSVLKH